MKFLQCDCCGFLAAIPKVSMHESLICPFCYRVGCNQGRFVEIDEMAFLKKVDLVNNDALESCKILTTYSRR